jgi:NADPH:quinone reductase and related Zn-dependent oxidoreductases
MKTIIMNKYNSLDDLSLTEMDNPSPKNNEVLIKVHSSTINSYDMRMFKGKPFMVRFQKGILSPRKKGLGCDVAGVVEKIGSDVTKFKIGDSVFGCLADGYGDNAYSEYVSVDENILAIKPDSVSFEQVATIPMAGLTALQALRDSGQIKRGQKVLVNGASGGVGSFAVQIAKAYGAKVTGVCRTESIEHLYAIGVDYIIDYTKEDFFKQKKKYDLIIDIVANHTFSKYKSILTESGTCVMVGFSTMGHMINTAIKSFLTKKKKKKIKILFARNTNVNDLNELSELVKNGKVTPIIDKTFLLEDIPKAFQYAETKHKKGKLVILIGK